MSKRRPLFSIVIPTRNRAHLLCLALQSAFAQTFDDYEIVVSNNNSTDDTVRVAQAEGEPKVRYVQTDRTLPMPAHWEFALGHARGEYVTYLCDDDAIVPSLLTRLAAMIDANADDVIYWSAAGYFHQSWYEPRKRNHLVIHPQSDDVIIEDGRSVLRDLYALKHFRRNSPKMLNSCCSRRVIAAAIHEAGQFFQAPCPDYSTASITAAICGSLTYLSTPLMLTGSGSESIGASQRRQMTSNASQEFWGEYTGEHALTWQTPLKQGSVSNAIANTLLRMKEALPDRLEGYELDWPTYFVQCWNEIETERRSGGDIRELQAAYDAALQREPTSVREQVQAQLKSLNGSDRWRTFPSTVKEAVFPWIPSPLMSAVSRWQNVDGRKAGFSNIAQAASYLDALLVQPTAQPFGDRIRPTEQPLTAGAEATSFARFE